MTTALMYSSVSPIQEVIRGNPFLTVFIVSVLFVASGVTIRYVKSYLKSSKSDEMLEVLDGAETMTVIMHDNPDPDAMACAMAVQRLAKLRDVSAELVYPGRISYDENRAFRAVLNVDFTKVQDSQDITGDVIALVDQSRPRGITNANQISPDIIIDHHDTPNIDDETPFVDIDSTVGSCSAILTMYLDQQDLIDNISETLSTALYHGIRSDTNDISEGVSDTDFQAINLLYPRINERSLYRISNPQVDRNSLETKARAILGRQVRGPFAVSDVGDVANTDAIPQAADQLILLEGVSAAVVFGTCNGKIRMSGRAYDDRIHLGNALQRAVNGISQDANAGGHARMAGGTIPKSAFTEGKLSRSELTEKLFTTMNGE